MEKKKAEEGRHYAGGSKGWLRSQVREKKDSGRKNFSGSEDRKRRPAPAEPTRGERRRRRKMINKTTRHMKKRAKYVSKGGNAGAFDAKKRSTRRTGRLARKIKKHGIRVIQIGKK